MQGLCGALSRVIFDVKTTPFPTHTLPTSYSPWPCASASCLSLLPSLSPIYLNHCQTLVKERFPSTAKCQLQNTDVSRHVSCQPPKDKLDENITLAHPLFKINQVRKLVKYCMSDNSAHVHVQASLCNSAPIPYDLIKRPDDETCAHTYTDADVVNLNECVT